MIADQSMNAVKPEKRKMNLSNIRGGGRKHEFVHSSHFFHRRQSIICKMLKFSLFKQFSSCGILTHNKVHRS